MELNESAAKHEHASLNIKVLLLIFAVVLIATLGYFIYQQNHTSADSADDATTHSKTTAKTSAPATVTTTDPTADWKTTTLTSTVSGNTSTFSVKYPADWKPTQGELAAPSFTHSRISSGVAVSSDNPSASGEYDITFDPATVSSIVNDATRKPTKLSEATITVDGKTFTRLTYGTSTFTKEIVYVPTDTTLSFTVALAALPSTDNATFVANYDLLIKSIKFIK